MNIPSIIVKKEWAEDPLIFFPFDDPRLPFIAPGDVILVSAKGTEKTHRGIVIAAWTGPFRDVPARILSYDTEDVNRSYLGMAEYISGVCEDFHEGKVVGFIAYARCNQKEKTSETTL